MSYLVEANTLVLRPPNGGSGDVAIAHAHRDIATRGVRFDSDIKLNQKKFIYSKVYVQDNGTHLTWKKREDDSEVMKLEF